MRDADKRPLKRAVATFVRALGVPFLVRAFVQRQRVTIVVYHDPPADVFAQHLATLLRLYSIVSLRDYARALAEGSLRSLPRRSLVITIDDGHRGNIALLPILEQTGAPVTLFLVAGLGGPKRLFWFQRPDAEALKRVHDDERSRIVEHDVRERDVLTEDEVRDLAGVIDFQAHTTTHPVLPMCSDAKAAEEIDGSKVLLQERFGFDVYAIAYPNGDYSPRDLELTREAGYTLGLTVDPGFNSASTDPFRLRRIPIDDTDDTSTLVVKASGVWDFVKWRLRRRPYGDIRAVG